MAWRDNGWEERKEKESGKRGIEKRAAREKACSRLSHTKRTAGRKM